MNKTNKLWGLLLILLSVFATDNIAAQVAPGYYRIICAYSEFMEEQGVEKAMVQPVGSKLLWWDTIDRRSSRFIWKLDKPDWHAGKIEEEGLTSMMNVCTGDYTNVWQTNEVGIGLGEPFFVPTFKQVGDEGLYEIYLEDSKLGLLAMHPRLHIYPSSVQTMHVCAYKVCGCSKTEGTWKLETVSEEELKSITSVS